MFENFPNFVFAELPEALILGLVDELLGAAFRKLWSLFGGCFLEVSILGLGGS